ncbi:MAG: Ig-like domain-containing protein [Bacteroidaceae bacterium]|nr:Ig-like domain-containing protein [Bacteroidaceae bacterium]
MRIKDIFLYALLLVLPVACASIGSPDGGPYDEEPPVLVKSTPGINATGVDNGKVEIVFDENIKLQNAFEKVVVSPPQMQMPEIRYNGKKVTVELFDSLLPNTTYSIDFNDAVVDNNEGNPYENFAYVFSTGDVVDTLAVSGTVLNAEDLEPIKGIVVGLHSCLDDSAFTKRAFERVSRTDSKGRFTIKGIAPGKYRVYALADANQNYLFDQKSEKIAFMDTYVSPFATEAIRQDTIWRDSLTIDSIMDVKYTRFQPDDLVLRAFAEEMNVQYLVKNPRDEHHKFTLFFAAPNEELPSIKGLGFDIDGKYQLESSQKMDTLIYWLNDSMLFRNDTLKLSVTYKVSDSLGMMIDRIDTLDLVPKKKWAKVQELQQKIYNEEKKKFLRQASEKEGYDKDNPPPFVPKAKVLPVRFSGNSTMDVNGNCRFVFDEPLAVADSSAIHIYQIVDSLLVPMEYVFRRSDNNIKEYELFAEWRPGLKYQLTVDSAAFKGIYGGVSEALTRDMQFRTLDEYAVLYLNIPGVGNNALVQLLSSDKVVMQERSKDNRCAFYFIKPGKYYLRLILDENNNGKWDTGSFEQALQPEKVYYYPHSLDLRALFEYSQDDWDINAPLDKQKPLEITKQKPDKERKKMNRNATRKFK